MQSKYGMLGMERNLKLSFRMWSSLHCFWLMLVFSQMYFILLDWNNSIKELTFVTFCLLIQLYESLLKLLPTQSFNVGAAYLAASSVAGFFLLRMSTWLVREELFFFCCCCFYYFFHSTLFIDIHAPVNASAELRSILCRAKAVKGRLALQWKHSCNMENLEMNFTTLKWLNTDRNGMPI